MVTVAHIETNLSGKFGVPRQSGVISSLCGRIVFEPEFRNPEALRGLEGFSHIWLIWEFSEAVRPGQQPPVTVRPPRLGGNTRMGVFATRSPFRPNNLGLTVVKIESINLDTPEGPVINVSGVDLMDGTPIFDIKPYIPYADAVPDAKGGYTDHLPELCLNVHFPENLLKEFPEDKWEELCGILRHDPRPQYQNQPDRIYGLTYLGKNVRFKIDDETKTLTVVEIQ